MRGRGDERIGCLRTWDIAVEPCPPAVSVSAWKIIDFLAASIRPPSPPGGERRIRWRPMCQ